MVKGPRKYLCRVFLDPNTADDTLELSEDNRRVTNVEQLQLFPHHQDRFSSCSQVLSSTALSGRCYWEVKWRGEVDIAVSYKGIRRNGDSEECRFGDNDQSWSLRVRGDEGYLYHNKREIDLGWEISSDRVGLLLDTEAGTLSFYDVDSDGRLYHLHTFSSSFSEPLFAGLGLERPGSSVLLLNQTDFEQILPEFL
uniref:B30.2/SPRY domain-containing protein n=1 Tax=Neogobius melanostomus TaxID=47308 RepID=A0A8C6T233_9GOBI